MDLTPYVDSIRRDLTAAADVAGPDARTAAERLTAALDAAVRLALMDALSSASDEITRELAPGAVEIRLRGREPEFVVTTPRASEPPRPPEPPEPPEPAAILGDAEQGTARITLRMPESVKSQVEASAATEGVSVNAWLVRAVTAALSGPSRGARGSRGDRGSRRQRGPTIGQHVTGWVR